MPDTSSGQLTVLYDTPDWLAIDKTAGVSMHSDDGVAGLVVQASEQLSQPLFPVHRLDKVTSGLLLLAKHSRAAAQLSEHFAHRRIQKWYLAISQSKPTKKQGWVKGDMSKSRNGSWKLERSHNNPAITQFITHFDSTAERRFFLLKPHTGKTHQLRVMMKSLSAPIDGDERYGGIAAERTYLHAYALSFDGHQLMSLPNHGNWAGYPESWEAPWNVLSK